MAEYFIRSGGSDSADGLSDATAWATVDKAANTVTGADQAAFRAGDSFAAPSSRWGIPGGSVIKRYGSGPNPVLRADDRDENLFRVMGDGGTLLGITFQHGGNAPLLTGDFNAQIQTGWTFDGLKLLNGLHHGFQQGVAEAHGWVVRNIEVGFFGQMGFLMPHGVGCLTEDSDFHDVRGVGHSVGYQIGGPDNIGRRLHAWRNQSTGLSMKPNATNCLLEWCEANENGVDEYDRAGISNWGMGNTVRYCYLHRNGMYTTDGSPGTGMGTGLNSDHHSDGLLAHGNIIIDNHSFAVGLAGTNHRIIGNVLLNNGHAGSVAAYVLTLYGSQAEGFDVSGLRFQNNICGYNEVPGAQYGSRAVNMNNAQLAASTDIVIDHNQYFPMAGNADLGFWAGISYATLEAWQAGTGFSEHGQYGDAMLTPTYRLEPGSPCIGAGVKVPGVDVDRAGQIITEPVDIGAYQTNGGDMAAPVIDSVTVTPNKTVWQPGEAFTVEVAAHDPDQGTTPAPLEIVVSDEAGNEARHTLPFGLAGEGPLLFALLDSSGAGYVITPRPGSPGVWDCSAP